MILVKCIANTAMHKYGRIFVFPGCPSFLQDICKRQFSGGHETTGLKVHAKRFDEKKKNKLLKNLMKVPGEDRIRVKLFDENSAYIGVRPQSLARSLAFDKNLKLVQLDQSEWEKLAEKNNIAVVEEESKFPIFALMNRSSALDRMKIQIEKKKMETPSKLKGTRTVKINSSLDETQMKTKLDEILSLVQALYIVDAKVKFDPISDDVDAALKSMEDRIMQITEGKASIKTKVTDLGAMDLKITPILKPLTDSDVPNEA